jgi:hypothetical protein
LLPPRLSGLLRRNLLWSSAVHLADEGFFPGDPIGAELLLLNTKKLWRPLDHIHTLADPFLFVHEGCLFLFVEAQATASPGHIQGYRSHDLARFEPLGVILREAHHLSYPHVFKLDGHIYLLPEASAAREVCLYRFEAFPYAPVRHRLLLEGDYADTSPLLVNGRWFLFTTSPHGLELFVTDDLLTGRLRPHPMNPLTVDPRFRRCGGVPFERDGRLFRFAQDSSVRYGGDLHLMEITSLSEEVFAEQLAVESLGAARRGWNTLGGHHMSHVRVAGKTAVAIDGQQYDHYLHKLRRLGRASLGSFRKGSGAGG